MLWTWGLKGDGLKTLKDPVTLQIWSWIERRHYCRTWVSSVQRSNRSIFQIQQNKPKKLSSWLLHLFFPGPQKPEEQIKKEPRSMVKHEVLPLGGSDFEIEKPLLQNEKVQTFNYLITADTFRSQNLRVFFFQKILDFVNWKCFAICQGKISSCLFKSSQIQTAIISALIVELIITDNLPSQKHLGIKTTCPRRQSVIFHKNKNDRV